MSWERGRYYTRSRRVNGRIVREYVGKGPLAQAASEADRYLREQRRRERNALRDEMSEFSSLSRELQQLDLAYKTVVEIELKARGYHQHHRGQWRKRRYAL